MSDQEQDHLASAQADQRRAALRQLAREMLGESPDEAPEADGRQNSVGEHSEAGVTTRRRQVRIGLVALVCVLVAALVAGSITLSSRLGGAHIAGSGQSSATHPIHSTVHDFVVPTSASKPFDIEQGADGNLWFTEFDGDKIGRITPAGSITEYPVPTPGAGPFMLTAAPNGDLWFTEYTTNKIGHITLTGHITEQTLPDPASSAAGITTGPDGSIWVTAYPGEIERIEPSGATNVFHLKNGAILPFAITSDASGALWFSYDGEVIGQNSARISRMTPDGSVTDYPLPSAYSNVDGIVAAPDGKVWFTDYGANMIGYLTPAGSLHELSVSSPYNGLNDLTIGPDGALWFTRQDGVIGRITASGGVTTLALPTANSQPDGIARGPHGTLWFTELGANRIGYISIKSK